MRPTCHLISVQTASCFNKRRMRSVAYDFALSIDLAVVSLPALEPECNHAYKQDFINGDWGGLYQTLRMFCVRNAIIGWTTRKLAQFDVSKTWIWQRSPQPTESIRLDDFCDFLKKKESILMPFKAHFERF